VLGELADDDRAGRVRELGELLEMQSGDAAGAGTLERRADEQRALGR
jgi:hypothetical protein